MSSFPIILNSSNIVNSSNNKFSYRFPKNSVNFKNASIAISNIHLYYSWFNISEANNNNKLTLTFPTSGADVVINVVIPDGFYNVSALNSYLQSVMIANNLYLVNAQSQHVYYVEMIENPTFYAVQFNSYPIPTALPVGYTNPANMTFPATAKTPQLTIPNTNIKNYFGFTPATYPVAMQATNYSKLSDFTPQVSSIQSLILTCSMVRNEFMNPSSILYSFTPNNATFGGLISSVPSQFSFVPIQDGNYYNFDIEIFDQD